MPAYLDAAFLTQTADTYEYIKELDVEHDGLIEEDDRYELLAKLRKGAGVTVITGPLGAGFWSLVSPEVKVYVEPDGYEYTYRTTDVQLWSYLSVNFTETEALKLINTYDNNNKKPSNKNKIYTRWRMARSLRRWAQNKKPVDAIVYDALNVEIVADTYKQQEMIMNMATDRIVALDWEWSEETLAPVGVSMSFDDENYYFPVYNEKHGKDLQKYISWRVKNSPTIWHNLKADMKAQFVHDPLTHVDVPTDDTLVMAYLVGENDLALKPLTKKLLGRDPTSYPGELTDYPVELQARYAGADTRNTYDLYFELDKRLTVTGQKELYTQLERQLVPVLASMEATGTRLDMHAAMDLQRGFKEMQQALRSWAWANWHTDIEDDDNQRKLIEDLTGYDIGTLDQRVLARRPERWMDGLLGYRKMRTIDRNFLTPRINEWVSMGAPDEYYAYPSFNQAGLADLDNARNYKLAPRSGRLSSARPNFQQQPRSIRDIFIAPPGCVMWSYDFSALEMRIAAAISNDPVMWEILSNGGDIHDMFRQRIYELTKVLVDRVVAKNGNFNLNYGGQADMLMTVLAQQRAMVDYEVAKAVVAAHYDTYVGYHAWYDAMCTIVSDKGYGETVFGRRRYNPDLQSIIPNDRFKAQSAAVNSIIQGTAADIMKRAMLRIVEVLLHHGARATIQVHDELVGWVPEDKAESFCKDIEEVMPEDIYGMMLPVEGGYGTTWASIK